MYAIVPFIYFLIARILFAFECRLRKNISFASHTISIISFIDQHFLGPCRHSSAKTEYKKINFLLTTFNLSEIRLQLIFPTQISSKFIAGAVIFICEIIWAIFLLDCKTDWQKRYTLHRWQYVIRKSGTKTTTHRNWLNSRRHQSSPVVIIVDQCPPQTISIFFFCLPMRARNLPFTCGGKNRTI